MRVIDIELKYSISFIINLFVLRKVIFVKRKVLALILCVILCLQLGGCVSSSQGNPKDNLIIYTSHSPSFTDWIVEEFEKKTHIHVNIVKAGTGELVERIREEGDNPLGDILWGGSQSIMVKNQDLWEEYTSVNDAAFYPQYQNTDHLFTRFNIMPCTIIINTDLLDGLEVNGYGDLLNPKLKGKIAMCDPRKSSTALESITNMLYVMGDGNPDNGWNYVEKFIENCDGQILSSSSSVFNKVINGEYAVGVTYEGAAMYIEPDSAIKLIYPEEGAIANADGITIIKNAKQRKNAEKFIDFVTSQEIQTYVSKECFRRSVRTDVKTDNFADFDSIKTIDIDVNYVIENDTKILDRFDEICDKVKANQ